MTPETIFLTTFGLVVLEKVVCLILGYLTVRLGHQLIASGAKGEFKFTGRIAGAKADLVSVSPGLLFVLLGVFLMSFAMFVEKGVELHRKPANQVKPAPLTLEEEGLQDAVSTNTNNNDNQNSTN